MNPSGSYNRKKGRYKVQCTKCGAFFNFDYKSTHEDKMHGGSAVRVVEVGAPKNPFEAALKKRKSSDSKVEETSVESPTQAGPSTVDHPEIAKVENPTSSKPVVVDDHQNEMTICASDNQPENVNVEKATASESAAHQSPPEIPHGDIDVIPTPEETPRPLETESEPSFQELFVLTASEYSRLIQMVTEENVDLEQRMTGIIGTTINPFPVLIDILESANQIKKRCEEIITRGNRAIAVHESEMENVELVGESAQILSHDPGARRPVRTDSERKFLISLGPHQPHLQRFPPDGRQERFSKKWYKEFEFLEYSIIKDAAFCFVCSLFPSGVGREKSESAWIIEGVRNWAKMKSAGSGKLGKLPAHFSCTSHKAAMEDYCHFLSGKQHVDVMLDNSRQLALIQEGKIMSFNAEAVRIIIDIVRTMGRQGLAFRGHGNEDDTSNFMQLCQLLARHNPVLRRWFQETTLRPYHVTYTSQGSQNEMISLLGNEIEKKIIAEIKTSPFYTVMADTTPDNSHKDIMSVVIRFTDEDCRPVERLLAVVEAKEKTGVGMATTIAQLLESKTIPLQKMAFQSYDFAAVMSGEVKGVQQKLSEMAGHKVIFIPCQPHRINTALEHGCASSQVVSNMFNILGELHVFFSSSTKRFALYKERLDKVENSLQIRNLSKTRWTARAESVSSVVSSFEVIIELLTDMSNNTKFDSKTRLSAYALQKNMICFDFIASLFFTKNIIYKMKILTNTLESTSINVVDALTMIDGLITSFEEIRQKDDSMTSMIDAALAFGSKFGVNGAEEFQKHHRNRRLPRKLDSNPESQVVFTLHEFYGAEFKKVLDSLLVFLRNNVKICTEKLKPFFLIFKFPLSKDNLELEQVRNLTEYIPDNNDRPDLLTLKAELEVLFDICKDCTSMETFLKKANDFTVLKHAHLICRLIVTAGYSAASNERTFSTLKLVKNYLRTTQTDERLNNLLLMNCEQTILDSTDLTDLTHSWADLKQRRVRWRVDK